MSKKKEIIGMLKDTLMIFLITLVAGILLGVVYQLTKEPIANQELAAKAQACSEVFYEMNADGEMAPVVDLTFEEITDLNKEELAIALKEAGYDGADIDVVYRAKQTDGSTYGCVIGVTSHEGYGGNISFYMGVTTEGTLKAVSLLSISETPGLGMNAQSDLVPQFSDKTVDSFTVTKLGKTSDDEVDAITSATITSNAVTKGVNAGLVCYRQLTEGGIL